MNRHRKSDTVLVRASWNAIESWLNSKLSDVDASSFYGASGDSPLPRMRRLEALQSVLGADRVRGGWIGGVGDLGYEFHIKGRNGFWCRFIVSDRPQDRIRVSGGPEMTSGAIVMRRSM